jgi:hypothetical protein
MTKRMVSSRSRRQPLPRGRLFLEALVQESCCNSHTLQQCVQLTCALLLTWAALLQHCASNLWDSLTLVSQCSQASSPGKLVDFIAQVCSGQVCGRPGHCPPILTCLLIHAAVIVQATCVLLPSTSSHVGHYKKGAARMNGFNYCGDDCSPCPAKQGPRAGAVHSRPSISRK